MPESRATGFPLLQHVLEIARQSHMAALSVALYDFGADVQFSYRATRVFHAASTIKLGILFALLRAAETGRVRLTDRLHVRNRFRSQADGTPFFLQADRDGDPDLYKLVGRTAGLQTLAETMIVRSSNLATNLLVEHLGIPFITSALAEADLCGLRCVRGVEDEAAHEKGINNQVTAEALLLFFRRMHEARILRPEGRDRFFDILFQQRFNGMIPAGLPDGTKARVAHKTGEISTICHDAGMIFLPGRAPYVLVVLTEYEASGGAASRNRAVAGISSAVYSFLNALHELPAPPVSP